MTANSPLPRSRWFLGSIEKVPIMNLNLLNLMMCIDSYPLWWSTLDRVCWPSAGYTRLYVIQCMIQMYGRNVCQSPNRIKPSERTDWLLKILAGSYLHEGRDFLDTTRDSLPHERTRKANKFSKKGKISCKKFSFETASVLRKKLGWCKISICHRTE